MLSPGTRIGPYDIEVPLGSGGAGHVFRARDTRLGRAVAIKVLTTSAGSDAAALRDRLQREARAISQLAHPHICTLYDIGVTPEGVSYLVMELLEGETLEQLLARGALPLTQAIEYAAQIADAVGAAHRAGIVHGDLKPGNIMVTRGGVKLLDFGLATNRSGAMAATPDQVTRTTAVAPTAPAITGTLQYLAPEQIEGRPPDERGDIFACGAVIYEMITARKAFPGQTAAAVIAAILREQPVPVTQIRPEVPVSLERLISACLTKDPTERWQNASDLSRELRWVESGSRTASSGSRRTSPWLPWVAGAAALLLAVATILLVREYLKPPAPRGAVARSSVMLPPGLQFPAGSTLGGVGRFAMSPDGRRLVFVGVDGVGNQMLWLRPLDSLTASPIAGTMGASSPFWSPDSDTIAFFAQGQLKAVSLRRGDTRVITSPAYNATGAWSGETILFTPTATSGVAQVPATGGTARPITRLDQAAGDVVHRSPVFLADGRHFLFVAVAARAGGTTPRAIYVSSIDAQPDEAPVLVTESGSSVKYAEGHLVFLRENSLVAQPFDVDRLMLTGEPRVIADQVELTGVASATFSFSETGALVYQTVTGGSQLEWIDRQGRTIETVGEPGHYGDLELSADARQAALSVLNPAVNTRDIWVMDLERGVRTRLTVDRAEDVAPVWSRDGTRIAFASNRTGHFDLYQKAATGIGDEELLVGSQGENYPASWGSDGSLLIWTFAGVNTGLMRLTPPATTPERWLGGAASQATLSRDGRWVAYVSPESGRLEVYVTDYPAHAFRVQVSVAGGTAPRWRADGREVFYTGRDNKLMSVAITPGSTRVEVDEAKPLFDVRPVGRGFFYAPAPDGQRFLINALRDPGAAAALTLVQNWTAALQP